MLLLIVLTDWLILAYVGGVATGGTKGMADIGLCAGPGVIGGAMLRDFAILSTAFGVGLQEIRRSGLVGALSLFQGIVLSFAAGTAVAAMFG